MPLPGDAGARAPRFEQTQTARAADSSRPSMGPTVTSPSPHAPAIGGNIGEDSEQELASVAWLEGGRDDDIAALGQLCPQEDAARIDVDGAGSLML